jgi:hypothetical protein
MAGSINRENDNNAEEETLARALADLEMIQACYPYEVTTVSTDGTAMIPNKFPLQFMLRISESATITMELRRGYPRVGIDVTNYRSNRSEDKIRLENVVRGVRRVASECEKEEVEHCMACCAAAFDTWNKNHNDNDSNVDKSQLHAVDKEKYKNEEGKCNDVVYQWISGAPLVDKKSTFQAHLCQVHTEKQVREALHQLITSSSKIQRATHNMYAWRIVERRQPRNHYEIDETSVTSTTIKHDNDDDGEDSAGSKLAYLLDMRKDENVLVVVSRWYGGIQLGPKRFAHIVNVARELLVDNERTKQQEK